MATCRYTSCTFLFVLLLAFSAFARAQSISGFSTVSEVRLPSTRIGQIRPTVIQSYTDTQEDYIASLYYNVADQSALFYEGNQSPTVSGAFQGNPSASGSYNYQSGLNPVAGLYSEVTDHIVQFFYVASAGQYYDPYGFSQIPDNCDPDTVCGDYSSGYWLYVYTALYLVEAQAIVGQSVSTVNHNPSLGMFPGVTSVMYQAFIPPDYVYGPPGTCNPNIYAGDNRTLNPSGGSYRAFQQVVAGYGGTIVPTPAVQATGYTFRFSPAVLQNNLIPPSAYNYDYLGQCSSKGIDDYGHASTSTIKAPIVTYSGTNTSVQLAGSTTNPVPLFSFDIDWKFTLNLVKVSNTSLNASGTYLHDCYPAHELSVSNQDAYSFVPQQNDITTLTLCLGGVGQKSGNFNTNITTY